MHAIKTPSFFRPSSRSASPAPSPTSTTKLEVASNERERYRPLSKLALATFMRPSPTPAPALPQAATPLVQDGSYLEVLSLKLSEAITRALVQPDGSALPHELLDGKRPIPAGRGHALGTFISRQVNYSSDLAPAHSDVTSISIAKLMPPKIIRIFNEPSFALYNARYPCSSQTSPIACSL